MIEINISNSPESSLYYLLHINNIKVFKLENGEFKLNYNDKFYDRPKGSYENCINKIKSIIDDK